MRWYWPLRFHCCLCLRSSDFPFRRNVIGFHLFECNLCRIKLVIPSICFLAIITFGHAQSPQKTSLIDSLITSGITFNLTPDGKSKISFKYAMQFLARHARTNSGTPGFNGEPISWYSDMVMLRNRLRVYTLLDDKVSSTLNLDHTQSDLTVEARVFSSTI
jgi:hypothetical protein